ncbi:2155_t:CDS:2 [Entrophospora sp. SA101]|nr:2155_t:CDS:2 [Entrophospora sp. SA101]
MTTNVFKDKEVYADYILVVQTKAFRSLTTAEERQQQKIKLESTLKLLKNNLERAGLEKKDILAAVTDHHKDRIDVSLSDAKRLRLVHDIITSYDDECAGINPKLDGNGICAHSPFRDVSNSKHFLLS